MFKTIANAFRIILFLSIYLSLFTATLYAQSKRGNKEWCKQDAIKLCSDVQPGEGRMIQCLNKNRSSLSKQCASHLQSWKNVQTACEKDRKNFCPDLKNKKLQKCMRQNRAQFSNLCKNAVKKAKGK